MRPLVEDAATMVAKMTAEVVKTAVEVAKMTAEVVKTAVEVASNLIALRLGVSHGPD